MRKQSGSLSFQLADHTSSVADRLVENVLDRIVAHKRAEIAESKLGRSLGELKDCVGDAAPIRDFLAAIRAMHPMGLIAEVKKASPSAGLIREDFEPVRISETYQASGAACISVLTDRNFFQGDLDYLTRVHEHVSIPVLRKDFILDPYQVYEARCAGADAVLLIAECLSDSELTELYELTNKLGMQALVEVYEPNNVERVLRLSPEFMGVNNRNLQTFKTSLDHTIQLRQQIPDKILLVGESGIHTRKDVLKLQAAGVHAILVGESLMRSSDIGESVKRILGTLTNQED